jgi:hypothetical protein
MIENKKVHTPWLTAGDRVLMNVTVNGISLFGDIDQRVI